MHEKSLNRRAFLLGTAGVAITALSSCSQTVSRSYYAAPEPEPMPVDDQMLASIYGPKLDEPYPLPAIPYEKISPRFYRQMTANPTNEPPGTIIVDTSGHFLYLTMQDGQAMRYGVGLGRAGFAWEGHGNIQYKRKWPTWTPPDEMIGRQPELARYSSVNGGMEPGLNNPLGARALYIFQNGQDTLFRIHGSPEWWSIGKSVSSGCVRMLNQDVCDLYDRVPNRAPIMVTHLAGQV